MFILENYLHYIYIKNNVTEIIAKPPIQILTFMNNNLFWILLILGLPCVHSCISFQPEVRGWTLTDH